MIGFADAEKVKEEPEQKAEPMQVSPIPAEGYPMEEESENKYPQPFEFNSQFDNDDDEAIQGDTDNSTPIETSKPAKTMAVPKQVPESRNERLRKYHAWLSKAYLARFPPQRRRKYHLFGAIRKTGYHSLR